MNKMYAYNYTLLRYVHDITTREFVTVGVVMHSPQLRFIGARLKKSYGRIKVLFPNFDSENFRVDMAQLEQAFAIISQQQANELPLAAFENSKEIAQSIIPKDDSSLQWTDEIGCGVTDDPQIELEALYQRFVTFYDDKQPKRGRDDQQVWGRFKSVLETRNLLGHFEPKKIVTQDDELEFDYAFKNGRWHCFEPVSLDLASKDSIRDKTHKVLGRMTSLSFADEDVLLHLCLGAPQDPALMDSFNRAVSLMRRANAGTEVHLENDAARFADEIERVISHSEN
jgi:hypothetical protein